MNYQPPPPSPISNNNSNSERVNQMINVQSEALELFKKKNADYGDAFATYGPIGVIVRMGDKISRLQSITSNQISLVDNEGIKDTLIDLHNYAAMAIMLLDEKSEEQKEQKEQKEEEDNTMSCSEMAWNFTKYKNTLSDTTRDKSDILSEQNQDKIKELDIT